jgi:hypothetical protein
MQEEIHWLFFLSFIFFLLSNFFGIARKIESDEFVRTVVH